MVVELLEDKKRWDQFVETSPQGLLWHKWDFLKTVERHSRYQFLPYCVYSGEELRCIFPFFITRRRGLTIMCSPPPNSQIQYLGIAFDPSVAGLRAHKKEKVFRQVTGELCREIDKIAPNRVYFQTVPNFLDVRSFIWKNFTAHLMFTYAIDLEKSIEQIWGGFGKRCKQGIKNLSALSPEVQQTNDVSSTLSIWRERFNERGLIPHLFSDSYLEELAAAFPQHIRVHSVSIDGRIAAATVGCALREDRYGWWIGGVNARRDLSTNEFLIWEAIQHAKSEGFKKLDLFGAPTERISEFKSKFDPLLEPSCYVERTDTQAKIVRFAGSKLAGARLRAKQILLGGTDVSRTAHDEN
jgi:hypothetical protein